MKKIKLKSLFVGTLLVTSLFIGGQPALANENVKLSEDVIQEQLDAFDKLDAEIKNNKNITKNYVEGRINSGIYPTYKGFYLVTKDGKFGDLVGHAGIIYSSTTTVESFPKSDDVADGVHTYANNWNTRYNTVYGLSADVTLETREAAADRAYSHIGKPYNWNFLSPNKTDAFYCSQLVYEAYKYVADIDLNEGGGIVFPIDLAQSIYSGIVYCKNVDINP